MPLQVIIGSYPHGDGTFDKANDFQSVVVDGAWSMGLATAKLHAGQVAYIVPAAKGRSCMKDTYLVARAVLVSLCMYCFTCTNSAWTWLLSVTNICRAAQLDMCRGLCSGPRSALLKALCCMQATHTRLWMARPIGQGSAMTQPCCCLSSTPWRCPCLRLTRRAAAALWRHPSPQCLCSHKRQVRTVLWVPHHAAFEV